MKTTKRKRAIAPTQPKAGRAKGAAAADTAGELHPVEAPATAAGPGVDSELSRTDQAALQAMQPGAAAVVEPELEAVVQLASSPQGSSLTLASTCTVKDAAALKQALCKLVADTHTVILNIGLVERVDTATMQLLCAFVRDRRAAGMNVELQGSSAAFDDAVRLLGVQDLLAGALAADLGVAA